MYPGAKASGRRDPATGGEVSKLADRGRVVRKGAIGFRCCVGTGGDGHLSGQPCLLQDWGLFSIIIGLLVEISDNFIKCLIYFRFYDNPLQRFKL